MKVLRIRDGTEQDKSFPRTLKCPECKSLLVVDKDDIEIGYLGIATVKCPECGEKIDVGDCDQNITIDNLEYPKHFFSFKNGKKIETSTILDWIKKGINYFRKNPDAFCYTTGSGNVKLDVLNFSGDELYEVTVSEGYYQTEISYEAEDYIAQNSINWDWKNKGIKVVEKEGSIYELS